MGLLSKVARSITAAALAGRGRCFRRRREPLVDLSTGINPHSYPLFELPATALTRLPEQGAHRRTGGGRRRCLWRAVGGQCRGGARHADPAAARCFAGEAGQGAGARADLCRACAGRGDRRSRGERGRRFRGVGGCRPCRRGQSEQSGRPRDRTRDAAGAGRRSCAPRAGCWSSTRPSWMSGRARTAWPAMSSRAASSCCARSENSSGWPACGWALRWPID